MENTCEKVREQIPEMIAGTLAAEKAGELQKHIDVCPACSKYMEALRADDKLLGDFTKAMQPVVAQIEKNVIEALTFENSQKLVKPASIVKTIIRSRISKLAAVAVVTVAIITGVGTLQKVDKDDVEGVGISRRVGKGDVEKIVKQNNNLVPAEGPKSVNARTRRTVKTRESVGKPERNYADADKESPAKTERSRRGPRMIALASSAKRELRVSQNKAKIEAEAKQIIEMATVGDDEGLIGMLTEGEFPSKVAAAEHLGEIADETALPELEKLNTEHGGWEIKEMHHDRSGAFAVAICKILTWDLPAKEQIEAWFDLLEGRGPAVPKSIEPVRMTVNGVVKEIPRRLNNNFDVGKRVAAELGKFDDVSIVGRLRQSENKGAAIPAVWMEVRDMDAETAIARCAEIARTEDGAQRYGAIHCLDKFGADAIDALDELAGEGYREAMTVMGYQKVNPEVLDLICWHLTNNKSSRVRLGAVYQLYGQESGRPGVVPALIEALYDPLSSVRRNAAQWLSYAAYYKKTPHLEELEEAMLIAQKHPDEQVREYALKALERLGSESIGEEIPEPPPFRTDLEVGSRPPLTLQQKVAAKAKPIEEKAAKALKMGPPEEAIKNYEELLELRPDYQPYIDALAKARTYVKAATETTEKWYPDAPYIGLKGRYSYLLAREPEDVSTLKEEYELARYLNNDHFEGWSSIFGREPKGRDQYEKALKLYEHIIEYYPQNEYKAICAKSHMGGLKRNLYKDVKACILARIDVFAMPVEQIVDSTDQRRNRPLQEWGDKTQAQLDFERFYKDHLRESIIELCKRDKAKDSLLDAIIERCAQTDPKIVEMAKAAKAKVEQQQKP